MASETTFQWADYVIFCASLIAGAVIGIFHGCKGRKQQTVDDVLMGGRNIGMVPIALSMHATLISAVIILGGTAEVYCFGTMMFMIILGELIATPFITFIYIPFIRRDLSAINAYEVKNID